MADPIVPEGFASPVGDRELAALVALAGLPGLSPRRFWTLLSLGPPAIVWQRVLDGRVPPSGRTRDPARRWPEHAAGVDPQRVLDGHRRAGVRTTVHGAVDHPTRLSTDPDPPPVLFHRGIDVPLDRAAVAIVGTRRCSRYGRDIARDLGAALAGAGVDVVSGLAHGIDAAAHAGALQADPARAVAVVGSGLDVVYPRGNRQLWSRVAGEGRIVSEWPLGTPPLPWRFPARNRIIASLAVAVVVVESGERGGSMHTVDEALRRDRPVFAVPGSIRSAASSGPHRLIADGAQILASIDRFVEVLAPDPVIAPTSDGPLGGLPGSPPPASSWLLAFMGWEATTVDEIAIETDRAPGEIMLEVERQIAAGTVVRTGARIERVR